MDRARLQAEAVRREPPRGSRRSAFQGRPTRRTSRRSTSRTCMRRARARTGCSQSRRARRSRVSATSSCGARSYSPAVGARAPDAATPTLASTHGNLRALTTSTHPDRALYATFRRAGARGAPAVRRRVRDAEVLHEPDVRSRRRRRLARSEAARALRRRLHPRRGVRAQRPVARLQPLDARVGAAERAVGLPRRPRRSHQGEVRRLGVRERAARRRSSRSSWRKRSAAG